MRLSGGLTRAGRGARTHACSVHNRVNALRLSREMDARKTAQQNLRVTLSFQSRRDKSAPPASSANP